MGETRTTRTVIAREIAHQLDRRCDEANLRQLEARGILPVFAPEIAEAYKNRALTYIAARDGGALPRQIHGVLGVAGLDPHQLKRTRYEGAIDALAIVVGLHDMEVTP